MAGASSAVVPAAAPAAAAALRARGASPRPVARADRRSDPVAGRALQQSSNQREREREGEVRRRNVLMVSLAAAGASQLWRPAGPEQQAASASNASEYNAAAEFGLEARPMEEHSRASQAQSPGAEPDYAGPGPLRVAQLPRLEHTCDVLFPACTGGRCLLRLDVFYPRGGGSAGDWLEHVCCAMQLELTRTLHKRRRQHVCTGAA